MALLRFSLISFIVVLLDQLSKFLAKEYLPYTTNSGAVFGILKGYNVFLIIVSILVIILILFYYKQVKGYSEIFFALILGGAIGNLIDRLAYGYVIDFINFKIWPSFNIADSAITIGVIGLVIYYWKK